MSQITDTTRPFTLVVNSSDNFKSTRRHSGHLREVGPEGVELRTKFPVHPDGLSASLTPSANRVDCEFWDTRLQVPKSSMASVNASTAAPEPSVPAASNVVSFSPTKKI